MLVIFASLAFLTFLPVYLILGVAWRFSVLTGFPVNETKNKKWRLGFLVAFAVPAFSGIVLGMVGMGNAKHFRDTHGVSFCLEVSYRTDCFSKVIGLMTFILILPTVGFGFVRLRTTLPHPPPSTFAGIKAPIALAKTPSRMYLISGIFTQLLLALGQFAFIQGFSTLRSISLCAVDAVLTSPVIAGLMSVVLMIQISATALVGVRAWLEQHIAKREAAGTVRTTAKESDEAVTRQSFTFDKKDMPLRPDLAPSRPAFFQRKTEDLKGVEDRGISSPFNFRKEGSFSSPSGVPQAVRDSASSSDNRRTYNPKTGGYDYVVDDNNEFFIVPLGYQGTPVTSTHSDEARKYHNPGRASSDVLGGQGSSWENGKKKDAVSTRDLWPPLPSLP